VKKTLIKNIHTLATFDNGKEIKNAYIKIEDNIIKEIGSGEVESSGFDVVIDAKDMVILPGFVNTHHHFYQSLFRAVPQVQDAKLFDWLVFLYEKWKNIDEEAVYVSTIVADGDDEIWRYNNNGPFVSISKRASLPF